MPENSSSEGPFEYLGLPTGPASVTPSTGTTVTVEITLQIGGETKTVSALTATDADGYKIARGLLIGLRDDADNWLLDRES